MLLLLILGINPSEIRGKKVGVYSSNGTQMFLWTHGLGGMRFNGLELSSGYDCTTPNRISYHMDFTGKPISFNLIIFLISE